MQICTSVYVQIASQFSGSLRHQGLYQRMSGNFSRHCVLCLVRIWLHSSGSPVTVGFRVTRMWILWLGRDLKSPFLSFQLAQLLTFWTVSIILFSI
jgi:hypothetical protein